MKIEFDEVIGLQRPPELTQKEHDEIRAAKDKISAILTGFRFKLECYAEK